MLTICVLIICVICFFIIMALLCCSGRLNNFTHGGLSNGGNKNNFTNKDDPSGWQLYLSTTCRHCTEQKKKLNGFHTYAEYNEHYQLVTNHINGKLCPFKKIKAFPFWYNTKTKETKMGIYNPCTLTPKPKHNKC